MIRFLLGRLLFLISIIVVGVTLYFEFFTPIGIVLGIILLSCSQIVEKRLYSYGTHGFRNLLFSIAIFLVVFRVFLKLKEIGVDLNNLILGDPILISLALMGFIFHASIDFTKHFKKNRFHGERLTCSLDIS